MNKIKSVLLLAGISLALVFTFSCSSNYSGSSEQSYNYCVMADNTCLAGPFTTSTCNSQLSNSCPDGSTPIVGGGSSSSKGGGGKGVPFNENSQIYYSDCDSIACHAGDAYTGSGDIVVGDLILGSVTNGIVKLKLPTTIPNEYLWDFWVYENDLDLNCTDYPNGIKHYETEKIHLDNSNSANEIGGLKITDGQYNSIYYWYFSKAGKITCKRTAHDGWVGKYNLDFKEGWNKIYYVYNREAGIGELSTNNILTKEVKWLLDLW